MKDGIAYSSYDEEEEEENYTCSNCNNIILENERQSHEEADYCEDCFSDCFSYCDECNEYSEAEDFQFIYSSNRNMNIYLCRNCYRRYVRPCEVNNCSDDTYDGNFCERCHQNWINGDIRVCERCDVYFNAEEEGGYDNTDDCDYCGDHFIPSEDFMIRHYELEVTENRDLVFKKIIQPLRKQYAGTN